MMAQYNPLTILLTISIRVPSSYCRAISKCKHIDTRVDCPLPVSRALDVVLDDLTLWAFGEEVDKIVSDGGRV